MLKKIFIVSYFLLATNIYSSLPVMQTVNFNFQINGLYPSEVLFEIKPTCESTRARHILTTTKSGSTKVPIGCVLSILIVDKEKRLIAEADPFVIKDKLAKLVAIIRPNNVNFEEVRRSERGLKRKY